MPRVLQLFGYGVVQVLRMSSVFGGSFMHSLKGGFAVGARAALMLLTGAAMSVACGAAAERPAQQTQQATPQQAPAQSPLIQKVGTVKSIGGSTLTLTLDGGPEMTVTVASNAKIVQVAPGEKDLKSATPIALTDLQVGDRILVRGRAADDAKTMTAVGVIAMKRTDLEAKKAQQRDDWQKRGIGGLVSAVDPATGTITISTGTGATAKTVAIHTTKDTVLRRYAPDSVQFDDAKPAPLEQIKPGDQVRARGTKSADGSEFAAEEIVSGTFRNLAGIITATDANAKTISLTDLISKKPVVVKVTRAIATAQDSRANGADGCDAAEGNRRGDECTGWWRRGCGRSSGFRRCRCSRRQVHEWRAALRGQCAGGRERRAGRRARRLPTNCEPVARQHARGFSEGRRRDGGVHAGHRCRRRYRHHCAGRRRANTGGSACRQRSASDDTLTMEPRRRTREVTPAAEINKS